ncbi:MAG: glutamate mutase L [Solirubrobacteraceae bacterium]
MSRDWAWLFDIGSTFTKLTVVDLGEPGTRYRSQAPTTVDTDVREGFQAAIEQVHRQDGPRFSEAAYRASCSSAAGGLALAVSGLVPRLSAEAGRIAALGAGAKLIGTLSYRLTDDDLDRLRGWGPDIVLLTGGTDGGDTATLVANADALAGWPDCPAVIVAGNREVSDAATEALTAAGIRATKVENILPELDRLVVDPVRTAIRDEFMSTIVHAKGIDRVREHLDAEILPTPGVVLDGVRLLAERLFRGGVMAVEVGGATTNVHSWSPTEHEQGVVQRGLPEPELKRTVEGDLGVRWNAETILELAGNAWFEAREQIDTAALEDYVAAVAARPSTLPADDAERRFDGLLATFAAQTAIRRHCGRRREVLLPEGPLLVQEGKDLRGVGVVLGTGGSIVNGDEPQRILAAALDREDHFALIPACAEPLIDTDYALYAAGLLADDHPDAAVEVARRSLEAVAPRLERSTA